jgi:hypothetical protein
MANIVQLQQMNREDMAKAINHLIANDFPLLIQLLYSIDIDEKKLKGLLQDNPGEDAGKLIANMIIARMKQKAEAKKQFKQQNDIPEEERW